MGVEEGGRSCAYAVEDDGVGVGREGMHGSWLGFGVMDDGVCGGRRVRIGLEGSYECCYSILGSLISSLVVVRVECGVDRARPAQWRLWVQVIKIRLSLSGSARDRSRRRRHSIV